MREPSGVKSLFLRGRIENEDISEGGWVLPVVEVVQWPAYSAELNQSVEEVQAALSVYSAGTGWLSPGTKRTIGGFQVVEKAPVTERRRVSKSSLRM